MIALLATALLFLPSTSNQVQIGGDLKAYLVFKGHTDCVHALAFSPDAKMLASASADGSVRIWDLATGKDQRMASGHQGGVTTVVFGVDGKILVSGGLDGLIIIWDPLSGKEKTRLRGHMKCITGLVISPDGGTLASSSEDGTVKLWDLVKAKEKCIVENSIDMVWSMAISPDGKTLAYSGPDRIVRLWEIPTGKPLCCLNGHKGPVTSLTFMRHENVVVSASYDGTLRFWDLAKENKSLVVEITTKLITTMAIATDTGIVACGTASFDGKAGELIILNADRTGKILILSNRTSSIMSVRFSPDGNILAVSDGEGVIEILDMKLFMKKNSKKKTSSRPISYLGLGLF